MGRGGGITGLTHNLIVLDHSAYPDGASTPQREPLRAQLWDGYETTSSRIWHHARIFPSSVRSTAESLPDAFDAMERLTWDPRI
mgnify:CR=1 FL=1